MKQMMPLENLKAAVLDALYHPIASAPIDELVQPGMKIAFICNDSTRVANTHSFMPILVQSACIGTGSCKTEVFLIILLKQTG